MDLTVAFAVDADDALFLESAREHPLTTVLWQDLLFYGPRGNVEIRVGKADLYPWTWSAELLWCAVELWRAGQQGLQPGWVDHEMELMGSGESLWFRGLGGGSLEVHASFDEAGRPLDGDKTRGVCSVEAVHLFEAARAGALELERDAYRAFPALGKNPSVRRLFDEVRNSSSGAH